MPIAVTDVDMLQEYIQGVVGKAEHHARGVDEVALTLAGMVIWRKDPARELEVHQRDGRMTNVLWVWIGGNRYALSYNRDFPAIEIRANNTRGEAIAAFSNDTPTAEIKQFFASL